MPPKKNIKSDTKKIKRQREEPDELTTAEIRELLKYARTKVKSKPPKKQSAPISEEKEEGETSDSEGEETSTEDEEGSDESEESS